MSSAVPKGSSWWALPSVHIGSEVCSQVGHIRIRDHTRLPTSFFVTVLVHTREEKRALDRVFGILQFLTRNRDS